MREDFVQMMDDLEIFYEPSAQHKRPVLVVVPASKDLRGAVSPLSCGMKPANP